jgi:hypothetical protein
MGWVERGQREEERVPCEGVLWDEREGVFEYTCAQGHG